MDPISDQVPGAKPEPPPGRAPRLVVGVDGGASKTEAVVLDEAGRELGRGRGGAANLHAVGIEAASRHVAEAIDAAFAAAATALAADGRRAQGALRRADLAFACLALAGTERGRDRAQWQAALAELSLPRDALLIHDAEAAWAAAFGGDPGVVLISGTGSVAYGRREDGASARAGGWGADWGDEGSGYVIAREGLRAAFRAHDGRGPATSLLRLLPEALGVDGIENAPQGAQIDRARIAALASVVGRAADQGDAVAHEIITEAGHELALAVRAVALKLWPERCEAALVGGDRDDQPPGENVIPVAGRGGAFTGIPALARAFAAELNRIAPSTRLVPARHDAATGAAMLALRAMRAGGQVPLAPGSSSTGVGGSDRSTRAAAGTRAAGAPQVPAEVSPQVSPQVPPAAGENLAGLPTEARHPGTVDLDRWSALEIVAAMNREDATVAAAVTRILPDVAAAVDRVVAAFERGGRLFYVGAGTSGRLGVLDASECPPTFGVEPERVQAITAGGRSAISDAVEGAEDDAGAGARDVTERGVGPADVVVGLAASGRTPYVLGALEEARRRGAATVAVACVPEAAIATGCDVAILPVVGPEVLQGSTRLKAGTAQKMVLNMLSTAAMVRTGRVFSNLMVDLRAGNAKLRARAERMVCLATGVSPEAARAALEAADWHVKIAIVGLLGAVAPDAARAALRRSRGHLRAALAALSSQ